MVPRTLAKDLSFAFPKSITIPLSNARYAILQTCHLVTVDERLRYGL